METHYRRLLALLLITVFCSFSLLANDKTFTFRTTSEQLGHLRRPWQTYVSQKRGICRIDTSERRIIVIDTVEFDTTRIISTADVHNGLVRTYTSRDTVVTIFRDSAADNVLEQLLRITSYAAELLLERHRNSVQTQTTRLCRIQQFTLRNGSRCRVLRGFADSTIYRIDIDQYNQLHGDVRVSYLYYDTSAIAGSSQYIHDRVRTVFNHISLHTSDCTVVPDSVCQPSFPSGLPDKLYTNPPVRRSHDSITIERHSPNVLIAHIPSASSRIFVFEFTSFLLVAGAPLSSHNGERIVDELRRQIPQKPCRYFAPGHHHPHYVGGIRPFVHAGATIITSSGDSSYYRHLSEAQHFTQPDRLQLSPRSALFNVVDDSLTISDGTELKIFNIRSLSAHCDNFYVFYLPATQELFQDELLWIRADNSRSSDVSLRQQGLIDAIRKLRIPVSMVYQSWPTHRGLLLDVNAARLGLE